MDTYRTNEHFREIVDRYCTKHKLSVEEALKHKLIIEIEKTYKEKNNGK